jgi:hypothetical protein
MSWLSKILFPKSNRHDRHLKLLNLLLAVGLVIIIALVAVLLYLSKWRLQ